MAHPNFADPLTWLCGGEDVIGREPQWLVTTGQVYPCAMPQEWQDLSPGDVLCVESAFSYKFFRKRFMHSILENMPLNCSLPGAFASLELVCDVL